MNRRALLMGASALVAATAPPVFAKGRRKPNFVVILCDDLGYGDVSLAEHGGVPTPNLARMAREGVTLTDYYAPANICTPSRAGLLTGRYPVRTGLGYEVIMQEDDRGLPLSEVTIPKALKNDYVSGLFGKWHLGHTAGYWPPTRHGFDAFFGIPYSHDMKPLSTYEAHAGSDETVAGPVDYPMLQQQFYEHAAAFIDNHRDRPFFVELALSAPHLPSHPNKGFSIQTPTGAYGATIVEIDAIVGKLMAKLTSLGLDEDTLVIFTSDNGPWFEGSAGGLRDRKGGAGFDGGYRVPFIARQPGTLPAGKKIKSIAMGIDILPTLCAMAGTTLPADVELDGKDISAVLKSGAASPHEALILFDNEVPVAIRTQKWKFVASTYYRSAGLLALDAAGHQQLYDVSNDISESYSQVTSRPEVAAEMAARLADARAKFASYRHKELPPFFKKMRDQRARAQD